MLGSVEQTSLQGQCRPPQTALSQLSACGSQWSRRCSSATGFFTVLCLRALLGFSALVAHVNRAHPAHTCSASTSQAPPLPAGVLPCSVLWIRVSPASLSGPLGRKPRQLVSDLAVSFVWCWKIVHTYAHTHVHAFQSFLKTQVKFCLEAA